MITLSFHVISLGIGLILGMLVGGCISLSISFDNRWSSGFGEGWLANEHDHKRREQEDPK